MDEIREFILTKTGEINEKLDKKLEVGPCETTLTQVRGCCRSVVLNRGGTLGCR